MTTSQDSILIEAHEITSKDRQNDYGTPEANWGRISRIASAMTGMDLTSEVCVKVLLATKLARMATSPKKRDNYVDLAGYAHVLWEVMKPVDAPGLPTDRIVPRFPVGS